MFISCPKKNNLSDSKARQLDVIHFDMESGDDSMVMTVVLMAVGVTMIMVRMDLTIL